MTMQEVDGMIQTVAMIYHLKGHMQEMAERENGLMQDALELCDETLTNAAEAMKTAIMAAMMERGDQHE